MQPIPTNRALDLYQALISARRLQLQPALSEAVKAIGVGAIDTELNTLVPAKALTHVAQLGLRGEWVFPVPVIIAYAPPLIGYYRMLLGISKKEFGNQLRYGPWVSAEESARIGPKQRPQLEDFCLRLIEPLAELVYAMGVFTNRDLSDLALLTLGPTLQGGRNNTIGQEAARSVFRATRTLIDQSWITYEMPNATVRFDTPDGTTFELVAGRDPDLLISQGTGTVSRPIVAIEIKGGGDASNAHNRAGEAEKSQLKAKLEGYAERWTVIKMAGVDRATIASETPSSTHLFEFAEVVAKRGTDWTRFKRKLLALIGVGRAAQK